MIGLFLLGLFVVCFTLVAKRLSSFAITAPMMFIAFGAALSYGHFLTNLDTPAILHLVAEIALIVLLFLDAARIDYDILHHHYIWPLRMLVIGLPLAVIFGALIASQLFPTWPPFALLLVAAILAPTDAALSQSILTNTNIPERTRRALSVESGLNDGLALPLILLFASLTATIVEPGATNWIIFSASQLILGPLVGVIAGTIGGWAMLYANVRRWTSRTYEGVGTLALAGTAYLGATLIGGNGFLAAFIAGLSFGKMVQGKCRFVYEFAEGEGQILTWAAFFLLGVTLVPEAIAHLTGSSLALILISLFIIRPLAIWISLIGSKTTLPTRLFFGWFGPRGLATALFALLVVRDMGFEYSAPILHLAVNTVWISALLHGLSAVPCAKWYVTYITTQKDCEETAIPAEHAKDDRKKPPHIV